jgi:group I intron endonuclease
MGFIYKITNNINGKFYIGKTSRTINWRFSCHKSASTSPKDYFHKALKKYGKENFSIICIKEIREDDDIDILEKHYIKWLKPHYNLKEGGQGGTHSNISKEKMSKSQKGVKRNRNLEGKKEWCEKLSISNKGKNTWTKNKKWWNNGIECKYCENQPEGFIKGRLLDHKRGLTPGLEVGTKLNITDDERKRRSEHMKRIGSGHSRDT